MTPPVLSDLFIPGLPIEPADRAPEVHAALAQVLINLPWDLPEGAIAARLRAALPVGVRLANGSLRDWATRLRLTLPLPPNPDRIGAFTSEDIELLSASWRQFDWQLVHEPPLSAAMNLALDEVILDQVAAGHRPATLRFWEWSEPAVILGRSQVIADEVAPSCQLTVARRLSGGGAMVVRPGQVITYSLALPTAAFAGLSLRQSYEVGDAWAVLALRSLGIEAYYLPINDIGWAEGKIAGAAQARRSGVVLHHTILAYASDPDEIAQVLQLDRPRTPSRGVRSAAKVVSPLIQQTSRSREDIQACLQAEFRRRYGGTIQPLTANDWHRVEDLAKQKYQSDTP
jgi:lipoate-protein ligase A